MLDQYLHEFLYFQNEIRMVLIGRTGSGISVSGNSILKQVCFRSDSSVSSVTKTCCIGITERNGKVVKVVDTPGLFGNSMIVDKIKLEILNCFTLISPGPHVIVYVLRIGRFTNEEIQGIERFLHMFGGNPLQYTIILFTGVDDLEWNQLQVSNKEYLNDVPITLKKLIDGCSGRCVFFNNRLSNSENPNIQLDNFFMEVDKMLKKNQDNGKPYYTDNLSTQIGEDVSVCAEKSDEANCRYPYLPQVAGGTGIVIATTGVVFLGSTSLLVLPVVGLGIGIGLKYFKYSKKPNDKLSKVLEEIKEDSNIQCTLS